MRKVVSMEAGKIKQMSVVIAVVNVIVFFVLEWLGNTEDSTWMLQHGAMYVPYILDGEYYRIITSMFLHFGFEHLANNMFMLFVLGHYLEYETGKARFLCIYLLSGIGGNLLSMWNEIRLSEYPVSAGASGAVFGIIGALFYIAVRNGGRIGDLTGRGLIVMIVISFYYGFTSDGIDVLAHAGGLLTGFLCAVFLYRKRNSKSRACSGSRVEV